MFFTCLVKYAEENVIVGERKQENKKTHTNKQRKTRRLQSFKQRVKIQYILCNHKNIYLNEKNIYTYIHIEYNQYFNN